MPTVAEVLRRYGEEYLKRFGSRMPAEHRKVLGAIRACRTGALGTVHYACASCGHTHVMGRSCGNRHCPTCQQEKTKAWLEKQTARLLPCPYFLMTFTLPSALRRMARRNQRAVYNALFKASSQAIRTLAGDQRFFGDPQPGFFGVLHTWDRTLGYHPHIHYVVPGGAGAADKSSWRPSGPAFFLPVKALSIVFRAKFRDALGKAGLLKEVDPSIWHRDWIVNSQAVGDGRMSLKYLATYVFRVGISDHRIVSCEDGQVVFSYRRSGTRRWRTMTLNAMRFIHRFLQHVLPSGLQKVRHYGFLGPQSKLSIEAVRWLVTLRNGEEFDLLAKTHDDIPIRPARRCEECGGAVRVIAMFPRRASAIHDTS
jgi:hypothetical protein